MPTFSSKLPIWFQLSALLRAQILSGQLKPGEKIGSELKLADQHGVSVIPVRRALQALEIEGLITRSQGRGTYVSATGVPVPSTTSLEALYSTAFRKPAEIIERGRTIPPEGLLSFFEGQDELAFVRRLAFRDGRPWSYGKLYFLTMFECEVTTERLRSYPLYRILDEACAVQLTRSHFDAQATAAPLEVARHLAIDPLSPVLSLAAVSFDATGRAVGAFQMTFPPAPFTFSFETLHRSG